MRKGPSFLGIRVGLALKGLDSGVFAGFLWVGFHGYFLGVSRNGNWGMLCAEGLFPGLLFPGLLGGGNVGGLKPRSFGLDSRAPAPLR